MIHNDSLSHASALLQRLIYDKQGPLTRDLILSPGGFGLGQVPAHQKPDATTSMICGYCSTGCSLTIHLREGEAINLSPNAHYPVNLGMACPKGWEALRVLDSPDRAHSPMIRGDDGRLVATDWETAMKTFCDRMKAIQSKHGPQSVAFLSTGQIPSEEMALLGALTKFGMGVVHGDGNTRQCMATAVVSYKESFGFDAPPYTYRDFEESDVLVFVGSNLCIAHPILWERVCRNRRQPTIVTIDPRLTETAMASTKHLALRPKSDLVLFYGLANLLIKLGAVDREFVDAHTTGFAEFAEHVRPYTLEHVVAETGLAASDIEWLAHKIQTGGRVSFWWTMGVNQSYEGVRTAQSLINLALMTGNIGKPGTGANSITGQCNAMGSRLFSNTTNLLGGHDFLNAAHREKVAQILGIDVQRIPEQNSWDYNRILEGILKEEIKGLWVIATNSAHSWINQRFCHDVLSRLDFLVVQDMYHTTETADHADLILPAAGWGEKEGTFINSERRIGLLKKVKRAPGEALADFSIFQLIAHYWGCGDLFERWSSPEAAFHILTELSKGQPCDISGLTGYDMIDQAGGVQWPLPKGELSAAEQPEPERRLFADGQFFTPDRKARFRFEDPRPMPEPPNSEYPFLLLTGRGSASQWHTQTRTSKSAVLRKLYPKELYVEINSEDASALGFAPGDWISVQSRRGRVKARAAVTQAVRPGQVFIPMHYATANQLTDSSFDPYSKQPSYKCAAVRLESWHPHLGD